MMAPMDVPERARDLELFTRAEVAALLKVKASWLRDHQSELPCTRIGRQVRYSRADIEEIQRRGRSVVEVESPMVLTPIPKRPVGRAKKQ